MLVRLIPFFPAMVVFLGAVLVALGGFWASYRQSSFNAEIRAKNDQISRLQQANVNYITGGDSFASVGFSVVATDGSMVNAHTMPDDLVLIPTIVHGGQYPLYDVSVRFGELSRPDKPFDITSAVRSYPIGNMAPGLAVSTNIRLPHHGKDFDYNIWFAARNGIWVQFLRMRWVGDGWGRASKVMRGDKVLLREVSDNFPRREDGSVDWGEPGAQDNPNAE